jgi:hypothetical protein
MSRNGGPGFGVRDADRRIGGASPLPVGPGNLDPGLLETDPFRMMHASYRDSVRDILEGLDAPHWDEVEDWDDAMPLRPTLRTPVSEWDTYDGIDPRWAIGRLEIGIGDSIDEVARTEAAWPKRVHCFCGHSRTSHLTTKADLAYGHCKAKLTVIAPDGGFGQEPCPCIDPEPALPAAKEAS